MLEDTIASRIGSFAAAASLTPDPETLETVRDAIIDVMGCFLVGADEAVAVKAREAFSHRIGHARVYGTGKTLAPEAAAMVNAIAGHAIEFDDWEIPGNTHPTVVIVPALLAACEGRVISGHQFVEAYLVGFEVIARLGEALNFSHYEAGWHSTATLGPIGAAAAVARLWALSEGEATHAVGIAVSRASGLTDQFGADAKPLQGGFAAEGGLVAASLARGGLTAQPAVLEGPRGYAALTSQASPEALDKAFQSMGAPLSLKTHGLVFKPYPSCGYTHRVVDAALLLHQRGHDLSQVEAIIIEMPDFHAAILPFGVPDSARTARFSLPFCAALALTRGRALASDFVSESWNSAEIVALMQKTEVRPFAPSRPELNYDANEPDRVTLHFQDGSSDSAAIAYPKGAPQVPLSGAEILDKFCANAGVASDQEDVRALSAWLSSPDILATLRPWS